MKLQIFKNKIFMLIVLVLANLYLVCITAKEITGDNHDIYSLKLMDNYYLGHKAYLDSEIYLRGSLGKWSINADGPAFVAPVEAYNFDDDRKIVYGKTDTKYFITPERYFDNREDWVAELGRIGIAGDYNLLVPAEVVAKYPKTEVCLYYYDTMSGLFGMDDYKWFCCIMTVAFTICLWTGFILKGKLVSHMIFALITVSTGIACWNLVSIGNPDPPAAGVCLFCCVLYFGGRMLNGWCTKCVVDNN